MKNQVAIRHIAQVLAPHHAQRRAQVLAGGTALLFFCRLPLGALRAQPPEEAAAAAVAVAKEAEARDQALEPMALDAFLAQNGGLSRLKLDMESATADEVAEEIKRQSGLEVTPDGNLRGDEAKVQRFWVRAEGELWPAVMSWQRDFKGKKEGENRLHLRRDYNNRSRWMLSPWGHSQSGRLLQVGPCTLVASYISLNRSRSISLDPDAEPEQTKPSPLQSSVSIQSNVVVDPKFSPLLMGMLAEVESATDDKGRALKPQENHNSPQYDDEHSSYLHFSLGGPEEDTKRIASLKGTLRLAVLTKREKWEIDLAAPPKAAQTWKSGGTEVSMRFDGLAPRLNGWTARFHVTRKDPGPRRMFKANREHSWGISLGEYHDTARAIRVLNAQGQTLPSNGSESRSSEHEGVRSLDLEINISRDGEGPDLERGEPAKIIVDVPMEWREVRVPFEFKDLPIPQ
jgi:hypothetical protein